MLRKIQKIQPYTVWIIASQNSTNQGLMKSSQFVLGKRYLVKGIYVGGVNYEWLGTQQVNVSPAGKEITLAEGLGDWARQDCPF
jgi:hypothetical protein